jgi:hypothetical protein
LPAIKPPSRVIARKIPAPVNIPAIISFAIFKLLIP